MAQNFFNVDDRQGNAYTLFDVIHVTGTNTTITVDQSAVSICHSPTAGQTALNLSTELTMAASVAASGTRVITVASAAASGTYTVVVRHSGSAAGIGSYKPS